MLWRASICYPCQPNWMELWRDSIYYEIFKGCRPVGYWLRSVWEKMLPCPDQLCCGRLAFVTLASQSWKALWRDSIYYEIWRRPRGPCPCRRPSVVTESYRRCAPLPPTHSRSTEAYVIYGVLCLRCEKTSSLRCFGPFSGKGFHLGDVTKPWFFTWF